jgi:hypothetical protein
MKYCADCKHYSTGFDFYKSDGGYSFEKISYRCNRLNKMNIVHKSYTDKGLDCFAEREDAKRLEDFRCGVEGKFWEAK